MKIVAARWFVLGRSSLPYVGSLLSRWSGNEHEAGEHELPFRFE